MTLKKIIYSCIIIFSILLLINQFDTLSVNDDIVVFVIDRKISPEVINDKPVIYDKEVSHGSVVTRLIKRETPGIRVIPLDVNYAGRISEQRYLSSLREVIRYKKNNPEKKVIVNISLAFADYKDIHHSFIKSLYQSGVLLITAAGNSNSNRPPYPAAFKETIAVASASTEGKEPHSNYGEFIDIAADGQFEETFRLYYAGGLKYNHLKSSGTSLAAPRVTGLVAKIIAINNNFSVEEAFKYLSSKAVPINDRLYHDGLLGAGVINKKRTLADLDALYFMRERSFIITLIFFSLLIFLWIRYGLISIFLTLLIMLIVIPILLMVEELLYYLKQEGFELIAVTVFCIVLFLLILPLFLKWRKFYKLKKYLEETRNPNVDHLIQYIGDNKNLIQIVKKYYKVNRVEQRNIFEYFKKQNLEGKEIIKEILTCVNSEDEVNELYKILKLESIEIEKKRLILEIIEDVTRKDILINEDLKSYIKNIIFSAKDMWLRYQALRTLYFSQQEKDKMLPILNELLFDDTELIRLEAKGLLDDYNNEEEYKENID